MNNSEGKQVSHKLVYCTVMDRQIRAQSTVKVNIVVIFWIWKEHFYYCGIFQETELPRRLKAQYQPQLAIWEVVLHQQTVYFPPPM